MTTEMPQVLDQRQVWFTNLLLLGFDPVAQEDKTKVRFCREMFCHINKKGMEVTLHFLFNRLDSHITYEEFRDCWPVYDKKQEAQFRKVCANWLTKIAKEEPVSKLPRLSASLLMSPGGEKFDQLMLRFTTYVLKVVCLREAKGEEKQVFLSSFVTSPDSLHTSMTNKHLIQRALRCHIIRHSQSVVNRLELTSSLHDQWRHYVADRVSEYRSLAREKRELESQIKAISGTIPSEGKSSGASTPAADRARKKKMNTVRGFWKSLEDFQSQTVHEQEVLDAIAKDNANKYTIDVKNLQFQIPDMIRYMYEALLREGKARNTFEDGKLNLISLLQLWNCALQVMRDRFRESELPSFKAESEYMSEVLQAHRVNLATSQNLRASLMDYQQSLKESIEQLEQQLQVLRVSNSPHKEQGENTESDLPSQCLLHIPPVTLPVLDMELLPPSPQKSRNTVSSPDMRHLQNHLSHLSLPNDQVSTPEAVHNISETIRREQELKHSPSTHSSSTPKRTHLAVSESKAARESVRASKSRETSLKKQDKSCQSRSARPRPPSSRTRPHLTSSSTSHAQQKDEKKRSQTKTDVDEIRAGSGSSNVPLSTPAHPRLMDTMPAAHDILATQIASAVADGHQLDSSPCTPEHPLTDPLSPLGTSAFVSCDKIPRMPPVSKASRAQEATPIATVHSESTAITRRASPLLYSHQIKSPATTLTSTPYAMPTLDSMTKSSLSIASPLKRTAEHGQSPLLIEFSSSPASIMPTSDATPKLSPLATPTTSLMRSEVGTQSPLLIQLSSSPASVTPTPNSTPKPSPLATPATSLTSPLKSKVGVQSPLLIQLSSIPASVTLTPNLTSKSLALTPPVTSVVTPSLLDVSPPKPEEKVQPPLLVSSSSAQVISTSALITPLTSGLIPPLLTVSLSKPEEKAQSPPLQFSSSPVHQCSSSFTPTTASFIPGAPSIHTPLHPTGEPFSTSHNQTPLLMQFSSSPAALVQHSLTPANTTFTPKTPTVVTTNFSTPLHPTGEPLSTSHNQTSLLRQFSSSPADLVQHSLMPANTTFTPKTPTVATTNFSTPLHPTGEPLATTESQSPLLIQFSGSPAQPATTVTSTPKAPSVTTTNIGTPLHPTGEPLTTVHSQTPPLIPFSSRPVWQGVSSPAPTTAALQMSTSCSVATPPLMSIGTALYPTVEPLATTIGTSLHPTSMPLTAIIGTPLHPTVEPLSTTITNKASPLFTAADISQTKTSVLHTTPLTAAIGTPDSTSSLSTPIINALATSFLLSSQPPSPFNCDLPSSGEEEEEEREENQVPNDTSSSNNGGLDAQTSRGEESFGVVDEWSNGSTLAGEPLGLQTSSATHGETVIRTPTHPPLHSSTHPQSPTHHPQLPMHHPQLPIHHPPSPTHHPTKHPQSTLHAQSSTLLPQSPTHHPLSPTKHPQSTLHAQSSTLLPQSPTLLAPTLCSSLSTHHQSSTSHSPSSTPHIPSPTIPHASTASPHERHLIDFSSPKQWRPLDLSGSYHSPSPEKTPPSSPTHPLKLVEEDHQLSSNGLFDEDESFLVLLSPQSD